MYWYHWYDNRPRPKPNILVISPCSLRYDIAQELPSIKKFFGQGAFEFPNTFNGLGWTALFSVTGSQFKSRWFAERGYRSIGFWIKNQMYLVPFRHSWKTGFTREEKAQGIVPSDSTFEKNYRESFEYLLNLLTRPEPMPYFVVAQLKYPHFPLIDRFNADSKWDQFLTNDEKVRVATYLKTPSKYFAKLPLLLMLTNDPKMLHAHPQVSAVMAKDSDASHDSAFLGLLNSPNFLSDWQASKDYEEDLTILKKIYKANALYLDRMVGEMLERLKAAGGLDNTVVIFSGDHGEVHMERGHLTHGTSWYDPSLHVPLWIRFPGQTENVKILDQTNFFSVTAMIDEIAEGRFRLGNFEARVKEVADPVVIARDCSNTWRAVRYDNKWKHVIDNSTGESFLFDLQKDPGENKNVIGDHPDIAAQMEEEFWNSLPRLSRQWVNSCNRWPGPSGRREAVDRGRVSAPDQSN